MGAAKSCPGSGVRRSTKPLRRHWGAITVKRIDLQSLATNVPAPTPFATGYHMESCMMCMDKAGHRSGVALPVDFEGVSDTAIILWPGSVTATMVRTYVDENKRVDYGACALALLIVAQFTDFVAIRQSATGTRIDYYLAPAVATDDDLIFNGAALLEVSGIQAAAGSNTVDRRIQLRRNRLLRRPTPAPGAPPDPPTYICVVEFGSPVAKVVVA